MPEGSRALAGIGCHFMAQWMDRSTAGFTQMGGEGASWMGEAPFVKTKHVFQNIGDGTYFHSGFLALRAAIASGVNVTYKILYNDAVAMTGGQHIDGNLTRAADRRELLAEGAKKVRRGDRRAGEVRSRCAASRPRCRSIIATTTTGCSARSARSRAAAVIIYDQTCAAEKRRRRKRNALSRPAQARLHQRSGVRRLRRLRREVQLRVGRCRWKPSSAASAPSTSPSCNKDYSCVKGFCPSFVTVHGGALRKGRGAPAGRQDRDAVPGDCPNRPCRRLEQPYGIMVTGVGGTGVVTIGAIVGMAAHLEGKGFGGLDMAGLAQKGGAVWSHLQIAAQPRGHQDRAAGRRRARRLVLGCDLVVSASQKTMDTTRQGATRMVVNTHQQMTGDFTRNADFQFPAQSLQRTIAKGVGEGQAEFVDATRIATALMGDSIATNMFMLGFAYQKGLVPVSAEAINKAIELNGAAVKMNQAAFLWGRRTAVDVTAVERLIAPKEELKASTGLVAESLDEIVAAPRGVPHRLSERRLRRQVLARWWSGCARRKRPRQRDSAGLAEAVARYYFKLLAYKDEYEVARLYTESGFQDKVKAQFDGDYKLHFHLAPPLLSKRNENGELTKARVRLRGCSVPSRLLAKLRGPAWDGVGYLRLHRGAPHGAPADPRLRA